MFLEMVHDDNQGAAETKDDAVHELKLNLVSSKIRKFLTIMFSLTVSLSDGLRKLILLDQHQS